MGFSYAPSVQVRSGVERATLVRRAYGLVFASVVVTMLGVAFAMSQDSVMNGVLAHPFITFICMFIPLIMAQRSARDFPRNIIFTFLFTFVEGVWLAPFLVLANTRAPGVVGQAATLTFVAFGVLSLYALVSRRDFSAWGGFLMVGVIVLFVAMLLNAFMGSALGGLWLSAVGVMIFAGLLVFDT